ncbi:MAG: leucine--tRNA ligase [Dermatophilus congolensis]|nr:leucine--tRNA ligase [Dermatophilus congolensis]
MSEAPGEAAYRYTAEVADRIERHWQDQWEAEGTYHAPNPAGPWADPAAVADREKLFVLDMFPYPSGAGLHVGHPLGYIATDAYARYQRMTGKNVLHALGYDAFGLPAEQYAIATGQHPRITTEENIANMRRQLRRLGLGHDDRRSVATTDVPFYRWTQWIFLQLFNAWFDPEAPNASGGTGKARPIAELEAEFASGNREVPGGTAWADLDESARRRIIDDHRLAYVSSAPVNWCPGLGTVLANEEVTAEGRSDIGNYPVFKRNMRQWMMRITTYADRLIEDLDRVDWPEAVKLMQRNWIGRSHGANVQFAVETVDGAEERIEVFTTRSDTLFGATFMVLAPEHPLVQRLVPAAWPEGTREAWTGGAATPAEAVGAYVVAAARKTDLERQADAKDKTGVFTGTFATNPVDGRRIPVFVADYVLMGYGTGAIMAVPAEDTRDWDFAKTFDLDIIRTVQPTPDHPEDEAYTGDGPSINSANADIDLNGMDKAESIATMNAYLERIGAGRGSITYKLRDWLFSRQRYWGEPFPIVYDDHGPVAIPESMLPVELPEVDDYSPQKLDADDSTSEPVPPLARAEEWANVELDLGDGPRTYRRELNVMPQWAGSCWYELRYLDPANADAFVDPAVEQYWMGPRPEPVEGAPAGLPDVGGVDLYVGGVEHAVLHLLYARFWHKVLFDLGHVSSAEPFRRLFNQGYIQAYAFRDARGQIVPAAEIEESVDASGTTTTYTWQGQEVVREYGKMGKSLKNVVSPDEMYEAYGADTFRVYEMSMGPLDVSKPWETRAVVGSQRFLQRIWRNVIDETTGEVSVIDGEMSPEVARLLARTIEGVAADYAGLRFNTAIAKLIEYNNALTKIEGVPREAIEPLLVMVAPVAPHLAEELWHRLGNTDSVVYQPFPQADTSLLADETVTCVVQVLGKVRARIEVAPDITEDDLLAAALAEPRIAELVAGKTIRKTIVRPPGLVNIVAN